MSLLLDQMKLAPNARKGAAWVMIRHPLVVFTSGRRDTQAQARVMAKNVLLYGRGEWLLKTYKRQPNGNPKPVISAMQHWINEHPDAMTVSQVADGLYQCMLAANTRDLSTLSKHFTGDAWDAQWPADDDEGERICADIEANMPPEYQMEKVIKKEGSLKVIHVQFAGSVEV